MYSAKQKVSDAAAVAKEHVDIMKAKAQEKAEKAMARTREEKEMAHEMRKAKEAETKMNMHQAKADHAAEKFHGKHHVYSHHPGGVAHQAPIAGGAVPPTSAPAPAYYPPGTHPPGWTAPK